jgi:Arc/MetJ family transcription regulator
MPKRTTIEIDEQLLARAKKALGAKTTRGAVEEALRRAADAAEEDQAVRATKQRHYLGHLTAFIDADILASEDMWR